MVRRPVFAQRYDAASWFVILIFLKPLLASLGVSWSNFTSLFCDRGLTEPRLGSLGLGCEISRLFLKRHWPPLSALIRLSTLRHGIPASGKWRLMALVSGEIGRAHV